MRSDQITVVLKEDEDWNDETETEVKETIESFFAEEYVADTDWFSHLQPVDGDASEVDETVKEIKRLLEEHVRPTLQADGGDVLFLGYDEEVGRVRVSLIGACSSCERSTITTRFMIANLLCHYMPDEVREVVPDNVV